MKKIDIYIIRKFLGTFFFALGLIVAIAIVFDLSEKMDDFIDRNASLQVVIFDYYLNFIPYFANLFSGLFVFISVIFFTSKMAQSSEFIAMLSNGMSFKRILLPYFIAAAIITAFTFSLGNFVIPSANKVRLEFQENYLKGSGATIGAIDMHRQISPGVYIYLESFNITRNVGYRLTLEKFENSKLVSKLYADNMIWDSITNKWILQSYYIRTFDGLNETLVEGNRLDTAININPKDFTKKKEIVEAMNRVELNDYIAKQQMMGTPEVVNSEIEKYSRIATPFSTFILTMIGVTLSARKRKGGMGLNIGIGILLSFSYVLFMRFSSMFAINAVFPASFAVWIPNILYALIAFGLYFSAPK
ncbi:MAG TPA: LptF/LptG family permease [Bacteroidales bacterium]|nr:LptF/LptG family permease [Bacteroidales bacterium]HQL71086.1 LptF/LptG family permease [Bacteroidales bacterium]